MHGGRGERACIRERRIGSVETKMMGKISERASQIRGGNCLNSPNPLSVKNQNGKNVAFEKRC